MRLVRFLFCALAIAAIGWTAVPRAAEAQLFDEPYNFPRPGGLSDIGMSNAYRQAILLDEIDGVRPDDMLRAFDGSLVTVVEGKDNEAHIRTLSGVLLPRSAVMGPSRGAEGLGPFPNYSDSASSISDSLYRRVAVADGLNGSPGLHSRWSASIDQWIAILEIM